MKKLLLILILFVLGTNLSFAQKENDPERACGTHNMTDQEMEALPWYGNNQYILDYLDSLEGNSNMRVERVFDGYKVAVQAWVYRKDDGTGTVPEDSDIMNLLNVANEILKANGVQVQFYLLCNVISINKTLFHSEIETDRQFENMLRENNDPNALNVHFVRDNNSDWSGKANFTNDKPPYSFAMITSFVSGINTPISLDRQRRAASTFLHEFGHTMDLLHTHQGRWGCGDGDNGACGNCKQEYVDRERRLGLGCVVTWLTGGLVASERNGDMLRDTQADPNLDFRWIDNDSSCNYRLSFIDGIGNTQSIEHPTDNDGVTWTPPTNNIMSYSHRLCRVKNNSFSRMQKGLIYMRLDNDNPIVNNGLRIRYNDNDVDEYENDNHFQAADTTVELSRFPRRHHTFHIDSGALGTPKVCDEDWMRFNVNFTKNVIVVTRPAPVISNLQTSTILELYKKIINSDGTIGIQLIERNESGNNYGAGFSRIERILNAGDYYVRVVSRDGSSGHYVIGIFPERENWGSYPRGSGGGGGDPDGEIDFGVDDPTFGGDIDGNGTLDYVCDGAQLRLQGLDNDPLWSVQWSTNNPSVSATNGLIQTNGFFGEVMTTAMISYNNVLVGNAVRTIWVGAPDAPTLVVGNIRGEGNTLCQGEPIYLSTANSVRGFATGYRWQLYKNGVQIFDQTTPTPELYIDRLVLNVPIGYYQAYVSACNACGCTRSNAVTLEVIPNTDQRCRSIGGGRGKIQVNSIIEKEIVIYPNPVSNQLTIKLPTLYNENPTQVELYNSIGQLVYSKTYTAIPNVTRF
ncbi:MAG: hypothetical protein COZ18_10650 [Flexibacter sp. CG_4_10_14_3_um_filter_32_15]|nr:MAG: hypothetical protein COZ18_10650 [Flexibacter sp. CG_4_10_14_3_um_filter_32_15]